MAGVFTAAIGRAGPAAAATPSAPLSKATTAKSVSPTSPETGGSAGVDFASTLASVVTDAAAAEKHADQVAVEFASGNPDVGIHETIIAAERAGVQIRYAVTLKNKLLDAYRELMNTQV